MQVRLVVAGLSLAFLVGCGPPESCFPSMSCAKGGKVETCTSSSGSRYKCSDGTAYVCLGSGASADCSSAARQAEFWCSLH